MIPPVGPFERNQARRSERGVALLLVLMVLVLLAALVVDFSYSTRLEVRSAGFVRDETRARFLAASGYSIGVTLLYADRARDSGSNPSQAPAGTGGEDSPSGDGLSEEWARLAGIRLPIGEEGTVELRIEDESGKLNLNGLVKRDGTVNDELRLQFEHLFTEAIARLLAEDPDKDYVIEDIVEGIVDWIDANEEGQAGGFESDGYEDYSPKNAPMDSPSELRLVRGMDDRLYDAVAPYVTVYPYWGKGSVNVNTAPEALLRSLFAGTNPASAETEAQAFSPLTDTDVEKIMQYREQGFQFRGAGELAEA
ncbi:MAG: type II secretion system minor pseudopilin GspK, partial [Vicinamibacteria bacterium]